MHTTHITIIGMGRVGTALYRAFERVPEVKVEALYYHSSKPDLKNAPLKQGLPDTDALSSDWYFLTVADDAIAEVARSLSETHADLSGKCFIHCSGTLSSEVLHQLKEKGAETASFHPMKAITRSTHSYDGTWFDMEGSEVLLDSLEELAGAIEARTFRVTPDAKPFLHASAVVASNYMVVLADLLTDIAAKGEVPEGVALKALKPLMESTLDNIHSMGVTEALTGPIARGDVHTILQHLEALKDDERVLRLYKSLGSQAVRIAERKSGSTEDLQTIKELLQ